MSRQRRITEFSLKIGTVNYEKDNSSWISLGKNHCYLSWKTGRTYFGLTEKSKKTIKNMHFDDKYFVVMFDYVGEMETSLFGSSGKTKHVNKHYQIIFESPVDYRYVKKKFAILQ